MRRSLAGFLIAASPFVAGLAFGERKADSAPTQPKAPETAKTDAEARSKARAKTGESPAKSEPERAKDKPKPPEVTKAEPEAHSKDKPEPRAKEKSKPPEKSDKPALPPVAATAATAAAPDAPALEELEELDPRRGRGTRSISDEPATKLETPEPTARPSKAEPPRKPAPETRDKPGAAGKRPAQTRASTRTEPDRAARRQIAGGPTADDLRAGKDDRELRSLREAELVLFPQPLPGLVPGWSWDLPGASSADLPEIVTGTPSVTRLVDTPKAPPPPAEWVKRLVQPNLPMRLEERVLKYLAFYRDTPSGRGIARTWAKKSGRYGAAIRSELGKAGLPTDLVWLSLVESAHNPNIVSPAGAAGLWQFMPDAGRAYGLSIDRWIDERFDPERSTQAACRYLSDLYRRFGAWELAMASYNMGHGGLVRSIRKYSSNDFWELSRYEAGLPWETTLYVPKILATAIVMNNRRAFGIDDIEPEAPEKFERVLVAAGVLLEDIARIAGVPAATIESLNPQYLAGRTPPSNGNPASQSWAVRVPEGLVGRVREALSREALTDDTFAAYVVRAGDTVESIAQARGATEAQIRALNRVDPREILAPGTVLLVPRSERSREDEQTASVAVVPPRTFQYPDRKRVFYRVLANDTLPKVANLFGVRPEELSEWNAIEASARLQSGISLQIFAPRTQDLSRVRHMSQNQTKVLVAGSPEFFDHFEAQNGRRRFVVRAKAGDSLANIGKRYGTSVASMERINRRSRTDTIAAGEPVVVYTERTRPMPGDELYATSRPNSSATRESEARWVADGASAATGD